MSLTIDVPGTPIAAWLYWSGELAPRNPDPTCTPGCDQYGVPDPQVVFEATPTGPLTLAGSPIGARSFIFADERFDTAGEHVMRASVPLECFSPGTNAFTVTGFAGVDAGGVPYYRVQYGVALLVVYRATVAGSGREVVVLDGADVANEKYRNYVEPRWHQEADAGPVCFLLDPLERAASAQLVFSAGGATEFWNDAQGQPQGIGAPERTLWAHGTGPLPIVLAAGSPGVGVLETDRLIAPADAVAGGFFRGRKLSVFDSGPASLALDAGDTWACFSVELLAPAYEQGRPHGQGVTLEFAALAIERGNAGGCLTRELPWWAQRRAAVEMFLPVAACGTEVASIDPRRITTLGGGFLPLVPGGRRNATQAELRLAAECFAARLNMNATLAGGGDCAAAEPSLAARVDSCCQRVCGAAAAPGSADVNACIEDVRAFNALEDTLPAFGPFL